MFGNQRFGGRDSRIIPWSSPLPHGTYEFGQIIGRGSFGTVYAVNDARIPEVHLACKVIAKKSLQTEGDRAALRNEIKVMHLISRDAHRHVTTLHAVHEDDKAVYVFMELCSGGDLFEYSIRNGPIPESEAARLFSQLASAVSYCHRQGVIHRDLKPENVLLTPNRNCVCPHKHSHSPRSKRTVNTDNASASTAVEKKQAADQGSTLSDDDRISSTSSSGSSISSSSSYSSHPLSPISITSTSPPTPKQAPPSPPSIRTFIIPAHDAPPRSPPHAAPAQQQSNPPTQPSTQAPDRSKKAPLLPPLPPRPPSSSPCLSSMDVKLSDFGLAVHVPAGSSGCATGDVGSAPYMAPETFSALRYDARADVWSLGVLLYAMLASRWPFHARTVRELRQRVLSRQLDLTSAPWGAVSASAKDLIGRMLTVSPRQRVTSHELLRHPWVAAELARKTLVRLPRMMRLPLPGSASASHTGLLSGGTTTMRASASEDSLSASSVSTFSLPGTHLPGGWLHNNNLPSQVGPQVGLLVNKMKPRERGCSLGLPWKWWLASLSEWWQLQQQGKAKQRRNQEQGVVHLNKLLASLQDLLCPALPSLAACFVPHKEAGIRDGSMWTEGADVGVGLRLRVVEAQVDVSVGRAWQSGKLGRGGRCEGSSKMRQVLACPL